MITTLPLVFKDSKVDLKYVKTHTALTAQSKQSAMLTKKKVRFSGSLHNSLFASRLHMCEVETSNTAVRKGFCAVGAFGPFGSCGHAV